MNALAQSAAQELAQLLPSPSPLSVAPGQATTTPDPDSQAVVATFVGQQSAELLVVPQQEVAAALAQAGGLSLAEALRPALEAAAKTLGAGVLSPAEQRRAGDVLGAAGMDLMELQAEGSTQAWFGIAVRGDDDASDTFAGAVPAPQQAAAGAAVPAPIGQAGGVPAATPQTAQFPAHTESRSLGENSMRVLYDVEMTLTVEIGRTRLPVRDVLDLTPGTVLELDRSAGAPADVMVNGRLVAHGEIVVVDDEYAVRVTEIVSGADGVM